MEQYQSDKFQDPIPTPNRTYHLFFSFFLKFCLAWKAPVIAFHNAN